jgi:glucosamine--fructose-6-phosphate aminotransferase (isomerizing)
MFYLLLSIIKILEFIMCGIVAYMGKKPALQQLLDGLYRLEYRGYDSAGIAMVSPQQLWCTKGIGRVKDLDEMIQQNPPSCTIGIAHTRWATHGGVTNENAHPHFDSENKIAVVHNGIIENMDALKLFLQNQDVEFISETDTEIFPHLIRHHYSGDPVEAVLSALHQVRGTYGIAVIFLDHPDIIIAARNGSPLVIGVGEDETVIASDPQAVVSHTRQVIYLKDRELAVVENNNVRTLRLNGERVEPSIETLDADYILAERGTYDHFMLKEIYEQPESIRRALLGRVQVDDGNAKLGGLNMCPRDLVSIKRVINLGCGTSYHAGMVGAMAVEDLGRIPASSEIASEFQHRHPIIPSDALFFAISQSGETADTLGAIKEVQLRGGDVKGVINVVGSTIARTCGSGVYVHSGPEIAVASTKAFTSQVTALLIFSLMISRTRNLSLHDGQQMAKLLFDLPELTAKVLDSMPDLSPVIGWLMKHRYALFLGRGYSYPAALEGALKLKEIAYVPCEAYPAGEMKHGPIAMISDGTPVIFLAPRDSQRDKSISNIREVKARGARVIAIHTEGDAEIEALADFSIPIPEVEDYASPILSVLPLQLIAYHTAVALDCDVDKPRNLAKSVTVE